MLSPDEEYMKICLELAGKGFSRVAPNPMVSCVIVLNDKIIGSGYHEKYGESHAEVNAINSVENKTLLEQATLYVNLEPCSHFGKTPPCADLIIKYKIPNVVMGSMDPFSAVNGKGLKKLLDAGINVKTRILEQECKELNKRFFVSNEKKRPYVILKWAQTLDGFIDSKRTFGDKKKPLQITNQESKKLTHKWRSEEQAIIVGTNTALLDNPQLTVREIEGINPLRIVIDQFLKIPKNFNLLDKNTPTLIFTSLEKEPENNLEFIKIDFSQDIIPQILEELHKRNIQSLLVEGGAELLNSFLKENLWDEIRVFTSQQKINEGVKAPVLNLTPSAVEKIKDDNLHIYIKN